MTCTSSRPTRRSVVAGVAALGAARFAGAAAAADAVDVAAAKREGKVVLYTSAPLAAAQKVVDSFTDKYGIAVELFRTGGVQVLRRFLMEQQSGHAGADVLVTSDLAAALDLKAKGSFVPFRPAGLDQVPQALRDPDAHFVPQRVSIISIFGRTDMIPPADMPKTWDALLEAQFKGKLVMTNPNFTSLQLAVVATIARDRGWEFYEKLNRNDVIVVQGNEQALNLVKIGERPIAAGADSQYATNARLGGHRIDNVFPADGTFAIPSMTAVVKSARNPNAAKLMAEYLLSLEAQTLWPQSGVYAARSDIDPPPGSPPIASIKVLPMDYGYIRGAAPTVKKRFSEIFSM